MKKIICLILFAFLFCNLSAQDNQKVKEEIIEVSRLNLLETYQDNIVKAEMLYKGKKIKVDGYITRIEREWVEMLDTHFYFKQSEIKNIANLNKYQKATFIGICGEYISGVLLIKDAILVSE